MKTEVYTVTQKSGSDLTDLVNDGENLLLREKLQLPKIETKGENSAPFKFRRITEEEAFVFSVLFPSKTKIEDYKDFMPNEALEALYDFKETCPDYKIVDVEIWHAKEYDPDPILVVGTRDDDRYEWADKEYIVARWGDALETFDKLRSRARNAWIAEEKKVLVEMENGLIALKNRIKAGIIPSTNSHSSCHIVS